MAELSISEQLWLNVWASVAKIEDKAIRMEVTREINELKAKGKKHELNICKGGTD